MSSAWGRFSESLAAEQIFGAPVTRGTTTVVPVAKFNGGGGGGPDGSGFGGVIRPVGAFVLNGEQVRWRPAVDLGKFAVLACVLVALVLLLNRGRRKATHGKADKPDWLVTGTEDERPNGDQPGPPTQRGNL